MELRINIKNLFKWKKSGTVPLIYQLEMQESGAAALAMMLGYNRLHVSLEDCRMESQGETNGYSPKNLIKAAAEFGMTGKINRLTAEEIFRQPSREPFILNFFPNHYVVVA